MKNIYFMFSGPWGTIYLIQGYQSAMKTSSHWRHNKYYVQQGKTTNNKFFINVPQCKNINIFAIWGALGGGGGFNNHTGLILAHIIYIYLHFKYGSNRIRTFFS